MKIQATIAGLSLCAAVLQTACLSNDRLLVGEGPDAGRSGSGGSSGPTGAGGAAPTVNRLQHPLPITAQEALTRMAAVLWQAAPDADLMSQAAAGHIQTIEDLYGPARQMLADPRATKGVGAFYDWWLHLPEIDGLTKDATLFPEFTSALRADMHSEALSFAVNVTLPLNGTYQTLMTAPFSYLNARLAAIYGVSGVTGDALQQMLLPTTQRGGLLTLPGLQALTSKETRNSPPVRGDHISERFLCRAVPPPPASVPPLSSPPAGVTLRQRLAEHRLNPACAACHALIDSYGLPFETFDAIGRWRTTDNGAPVDVTNIQLPPNDFPNTTLNNGPVELAGVMASNGEAQECMARQWLAYALKKDPFAFTMDPTSLDAVTIAQAMTPFRTSGFNLKELIAAVLLTDAFLAS